MRRRVPLIMPGSYQRYDCHRCGACCRAGFAVVVTDEERARIAAQGWERLPLYRGKPLFIRQIGGEHILAQAEDGACIFLDENNTCRIHAQFGAEAKPFACRPYPFVFLPAGPEVRVSLRFDCPSVAANTGRPLPQHHDEAAVLAARALPPEARDLPPPLFRPGVRLEWGDLRRVADTLERMMAAEALDITRRVLACADVAGVQRDLARRAQAVVASLTFPQELPA
ncbi:MAG: YkgJ family cysteine cluster protein [Armatimonadota bacterium]|nr:YkgJ family cysteine cluster protein [Armatimonadota bacterium]